VFFPPHTKLSLYPPPWFRAGVLITPPRHRTAWHLCGLGPAARARQTHPPPLPPPPLAAPGSAGLRAPGSGLRAPGSGLRAPGSVLRASGSGLRAPGSGLRAPGSWLPGTPGRRDLRVEYSGDACIVGHASGFVVGLIGPSDSDLSADVASRLRPGRSPWSIFQEMTWCKAVSMGCPLSLPGRPHRLRLVVRPALGQGLVLVLAATCPRELTAVSKRGLIGRCLLGPQSGL
jgi:hypothetical protein